MVWQYFVEALEERGRRLTLPDAVLLHSGGWKKLEALKVDPESFRRRLYAATGIERVLNYYGMVEQVGSVYLENPRHFLHAPVYRGRDRAGHAHLRAARAGGEPGLVQVVSALPTSYPGHSLLTEDLGVVEGSDDAATGMGGRYFRLLGRLPKAELRGCSDTFQQAAGATA